MVLVSAFAVAGLAATALPAQAAEVGVTDSEIVLGMQLP
jgi:hypothetical protein